MAFTKKSMKRTNAKQLKLLNPNQRKRPTSYTSIMWTTPSSIRFLWDNWRLLSNARIVITKVFVGIPFGTYHCLYPKVTTIALSKNVSNDSQGMKSWTTRNRYPLVFNAIKSLSIIRCPLVLIIQLKKFANDGLKISKNVKINEMIAINSFKYYLYACICHKRRL